MKHLDLSHYGGGAPKRCKKGTNKKCLTPSEMKVFKVMMTPPSTTGPRVAKGKVKNGMQFLRPSSYKNKPLPALPYYNKPLPPIPRYNKPLPAIPTLSQRVSSKVDAYRRLRPGTRVAPFGLNEPFGLNPPSQLRGTPKADLGYTQQYNRQLPSLFEESVESDLVTTWINFVIDTADEMMINTGVEWTPEIIHHDPDMNDKVLVQFHRAYPEVEIVQNGRTFKAALKKLAESISRETNTNITPDDAERLAKDEFGIAVKLQRIFQRDNRDNPEQLLII